MPTPYHATSCPDPSPLPHRCCPQAEERAKAVEAESEALKAQAEGVRAEVAAQQQALEARKAELETRDKTVGARDKEMVAREKKVGSEVGVGEVWRWRCSRRRWGEEGRAGGQGGGQGQGDGGQGEEGECWGGGGQRGHSPEGCMRLHNSQVGKLTLQHEQGCCLLLLVAFLPCMLNVLDH